MTSVLAFLRWLAGYPVPPAPPTHDTLEPYYTEAVLRDRHAAAPTHPADDKAIHRIAARYGAEL